MADETKRLDFSSKETQKLQKETEKLTVGETEKIGVEIKKDFSIFFVEGQIVKDKYKKGRYKVMGVIGRPSGESLLYLCEDTTENRNVVLKLYHRGFIPKEEIIKKIVEVTHPDIINVLDYDYIGDQFYEIMDYAEGGTLLERLQERTFSEEELIRHVIPEVLSGLKFCHSNNIIHRDIKSGNIFYRDKAKEDIVIGDFGISTSLEEGMSVRKTKGAMTYDYAAPELFGWKGEVYVGKEVDYYAFGITLIHLFIGISPFEGLTELQIMTQHTSEKICLPDNLSDRFKKLLSGLLIKERKKRWGASEIERWLKGEDVPIYEDELRVYTPSIPPYKFSTNAIAKTPKELALLIQAYNDRELIKRHFSKGWFSHWLKDFDQTLAVKVAEAEEKQRDVDLALLEIIYILDPEMPYVLLPGNQAKTPEELTTLIDKNWEVGKEHIVSGKISIWLKHAGYQDIYEKLEKIRKEFNLNQKIYSTPYGVEQSTEYIRKEFNQQQDRGVEIFLQLLGLQKPEFNLNPAKLDIDVIESTTGEIEQKIKLTHNGERGYLYGEMKFSEKINGISFSAKEDIEEDRQLLIKQIRDAETKKDGKTYLALEHRLKELEKSLQKGFKETDIVKLSLWPGESFEFNLKIDSEKLTVNKKYEFCIITKTNAISEKNLPVSLFVDYPAYSKKKAKISFIINDRDFYTLKDLAGYCHKMILSESDISYLLDERLTKWVKNDLGEINIAQKIEGIINSADIAFSEKCYRFLKLCGVFSEKKLFDLFKKLRLEEFEDEKESKIAKVRMGIQQRVKERMSRIFWEGMWGSLVGWGIGSGILLSIIFPIIDYMNLQSAFYRFSGESNFDPPVKMPVLPDGSIYDTSGMGFLLGALLGIIICLLVRSNRANKVTTHREEEQELLAETKVIESEIERKIAGVDGEVLQIRSGKLTTKAIPKEDVSNMITEPRIKVGVPMVVLSILAIIFLIPTIKAFQIPSHPIFTPVCSDAQNIEFKPPLKTAKVHLSPDCWSGWIDAQSTKNWGIYKYETLATLFWDGTYFPLQPIGVEWKYQGRSHYFRLFGEGTAIVNVKYTEEVENAFSANLSGKWKGRVGSGGFWGKSKPAKLFISQNGLRLSGKIIYEGIEEDLEGEIANNGQIVLRGVSYRRLSGQGDFNLDTFNGVMPNKTTIKGNYVDTSGSRGEWSVSKVKD